MWKGLYGHNQKASSWWRAITCCVVNMYQEAHLMIFSDGDTESSLCQVPSRQRSESLLVDVRTPLLLQDKTQTHTEEFHLQCFRVKVHTHTIWTRYQLHVITAQTESTVSEDYPISTIYRHTHTHSIFTLYRLRSISGEANVYQV